MHNHFKDPDKTLAELGVDISDNSLDAILLIADSARQATINRIASVDCGTATESCLWYEEVTPVHAPTGVETARRYNDGTFMENVLNFIGLSAENGWFNLNVVGDAVDEIENFAKSVGLAKSIVSEFGFVPFNQTYLDYENVIPDSKTIKLLDNDEQLLKFHPTGVGGGKKAVRVVVEYKKDFPYDDLLEDTDLPGTKTHTNIKVKVDKKMATQTLVYEPEFDADGNEIPFKPTKDNCDIIDDIDNKQSQRTLGHAMKLMSAPLVVYFGYQELWPLGSQPMV